MNFLKACVIKDLRRRLRDPWVLVLWLGIPLVIGTMITSISGGGDGPRPSARLLVADEDKTLVSALLVQAFRSGPMQDLVVVDRVSRSVGEARIADGDGSALLVIPKGFGAAALAEEETELMLIKNPAQAILPDLLEQTLSLLVDGGFYLHRILGKEILALAGDPAVAPKGRQGLMDIDFSQLGTALNEAATRLTPFLTPPLVTLSVSHDQQTEGQGRARDFAFLLFPGILLMAVLFTAQGISEDYWKERELGTLRRVTATPNSLTQLLAGKVIAGLILLAGVCLLLLIIGFLYHDLPARRLPLALIWLGLGGLIFVNLIGLIKIYAPSRRAGALITTLLIFPLLMIGGSFFPFEAMPGWMAAMGQWTPNGHVVAQLKLILLDQFDPKSLVLDFVWLISLGLLLFVAALRRHNLVFGRS